ncbi:MAG TPA: hypothetical protein VGM69_08345 [Chloroflexota bacterium]
MITRRGHFTTHLRFEAQTEDGRTIARSDVFNGDYSGAHKHRSDHAAAHRQLVEGLLAAGWEQIGQDERWYELRFGRSPSVG